MRYLLEQLAPGATANAQRDEEPAVAYIARMTKMFHATCAGLHALGKQALVPHEDRALVDSVCQGARRTTMIAFDDLFMEDGFTEDDMTWQRFQMYFFQSCTYG